MENDNQNQPPQPVAPAPVTAAPVSAPIQKSWYQDKMVLSLAILVVLAALLLIAYFVLNRSSSSENPNPVTKIIVTQNPNAAALATLLAQCKSDTTAEQGDCYKQYGELSKDISSCKNIAVYPNDVACAIGVAVASNNDKLCDQVSSFLSNQSLQYGVEDCYNGYAAANKDTEICAAMSGSTAQQTQFQQDSCYTGMATQSLDDSYCADIIDTASQDQCYEILGVAKSDTTVCDKISASDPEFKGECYLNIAKATNNSSLCSQLAFNPGDQTGCYEMFSLSSPATASTSPSR